MMYHSVALGDGWEGSLIRELFLRGEPFGRENVRIGSICYVQFEHVDGQPTNPFIIYYFLACCTSL